MLVVLPFFHGDEPLAYKNIQWIQELDPVIDAECVLSFDNKTNPERVAAVARKVFKTVYYCTYNPPTRSKWPNASNWVFQHTAWHIWSNFKEPWLWLESDCVPIRSGWYNAIKECHYEGGKPFTGHWNYHTNVWNGVSVYPWNAVEYGTRLMLVKNNPWDVWASRDIQPHLNIANHLFQHIWQDDTTGKAYHFTSVEQAKRVVREGVVLFHRDKTGSLQDIIRGHKQEFFAKPAVRQISVQRTGAIGDVITASVVVDKLKELGFDVTLHADPRASIPLQNTHKLAPPIDHPDVNLDGAYEGNPDRKKKHCTHLFIDKANEQLAGKGIILGKANLTPVIKAAYPTESLGPRPWIGVCPKSNSFLNRTVPKSTWQHLAHSELGTWVWLGTDEAPAKFLDRRCRNLESLTALISQLDVMVSVDTGPLHIAAALGIPVVGIAQSNTPWLTDQRDFSVISAPLDCINCHELTCPINATSPPCCHIEPAVIQQAVADKLEARHGNKVSAVIAVYNPSMDRLRKCIAHTIAQVDEIIVSWDGGGVIRWKDSDFENPKIQYVWNPYKCERQGYGITTNRGVRHSKGRYILLLNDDVFLKPDAVKKMMAAAVADKVGIVGCLLRYPDGTIQHGGGVRKMGDVGWGHRDHKKLWPSITERVELEFVTLAAGIVRREAFYEVRGFDEDYDTYCEDASLCLSIRQKGWKVIYDPNAEGIHEESQTTGPMKKELGKASYVTFKKKWQWYFEKNYDNTLGTFT